VSAVTPVRTTTAEIAGMDTGLQGLDPCLQFLPLRNRSLFLTKASAIGSR